MKHSLQLFNHSPNSKMLLVFHYLSECLQMYTTPPVSPIWECHVKTLFIKSCKSDLSFHDIHHSQHMLHSNSFFPRTAEMWNKLSSSFSTTIWPWALQIKGWINMSSSHSIRTFIFLCPPILHSPAIVFICLITITL